MFFVVDRLCEQTGRPDRFVAAVLGAAVIPVAVNLFDRPSASTGSRSRTASNGPSPRSRSRTPGHFLVIVRLILAAFGLASTGRPRCCRP